MPSIRSRAKYTLFDLVSWVIFSGFFLGFIRWDLRDVRDDYEPIVLLVCFSVWSIVYSIVHGFRTGLVCKECGRRFPPTKGAPSGDLCPQCRKPSLTNAEFKRNQVIGWFAILILIAMVAIPIGMALWNAFGDRFDASGLIAVPLLVLAVGGGLLVSLILAIAIALMIRDRRSLVEKHALAFARKCAQEEGTIDQHGSLTVWRYGPTDPTSMLIEQMETSRERLERLLGEKVETVSPVRALVFETRKAFLAYHRNVIGEMVGLDGLYVPRAAYNITLPIEVTSYRLHDVERTARSLFIMYFLGRYKGISLTNWLSNGVGRALSKDVGNTPNWQLNKQMKLALAIGTALDVANLFELLPRELPRLLQRSADHATFARIAQYMSQSESIVEYLAGSDAPADRIGRFRSFLADVQPSSSVEQLFAHHFGYGFKVLLGEWQKWVQERGPESDPLPSPAIRAAIVERLVPTIRDPAQKVQARIQAIREMGSAGFAVGADTLIDLLRDGDERFTKEAVWALESISGRVMGKTPDRWAKWWTGLNPETVGLAETVDN